MKEELEGWNGLSDLVGLHSEYINYFWTFLFWWHLPLDDSFGCILHQCLSMNTYKTLISNFPYIAVLCMARPEDFTYFILSSLRMATHNNRKVEKFPTNCQQISLNDVFNLFMQTFLLRIYYLLNSSLKLLAESRCTSGNSKIIPSVLRHSYSSMNK